MMRYLCFCLALCLWASRLPAVTFGAIDQRDSSRTIDSVRLARPVPPIPPGRSYSNDVLFGFGATLSAEYNPALPLAINNDIATATCLGGYQIYAMLSRRFGPSHLEPLRWALEFHLGYSKIWGEVNVDDLLLCATDTGGIVRGNYHSRVVLSYLYFKWMYKYRIDRLDLWWIGGSVTVGLPLTGELDERIVTDAPFCLPNVREYQIDAVGGTMRRTGVELPNMVRSPQLGVGIVITYDLYFFRKVGWFPYPLTPMLGYDIMTTPMGKSYSLGSHRLWLGLQLGYPLEPSYTAN